MKKKKSYEIKEIFVYRTEESGKESHFSIITTGDKNDSDNIKIIDGKRKKRVRLIYEYKELFLKKLVLSFK